MRPSLPPAINQTKYNLRPISLGTICMVAKGRLVPYQSQECWESDPGNILPAT
jgi:hypothetical protein